MQPSTQRPPLPCHFTRHIFCRMTQFGHRSRRAPPRRSTLHPHSTTAARWYTGTPSIPPASHAAPAPLGAPHELTRGRTHGRSHTGPRHGLTRAHGTITRRRQQLGWLLAVALKLLHLRVRHRGADAGRRRPGLHLSGHLWKRTPSGLRPRLQLLRALSRGGLCAMSY